MCLPNVFSLCIAPCAAGMRLVGGNIANEGRVEICINNVWGTVCLDSWGIPDAAVVCRQLGYSTQGQFQVSLTNIFQCNCMHTSDISTDAVAFSNANFGTGIGPIYLDNVDCSGSEHNLLDCSRSYFVNCNSGRAGGAAVRCQGY